MKNYYFLTLKDKDNEIAFDKVSLKTITDYTIKFKNRDELFKNLKYHYKDLEILKNPSIYITYNYLEERKLDIIYSSQAYLIKDINLDKDRAIIDDEKALKSLFDEIKECNQKKEFRSILINGNNNKKLKTILEEELNEIHYRTNWSSNIMEYLKSYRTFYDFVLSIQKFQNKFGTKNEIKQKLAEEDASIIMDYYTKKL